ncbi:hypothetical protein CesoFtcFv8_004456 [Champsocephalus esox]|uniref:Uncharacterized protein n=1 Tax=Champsocephalus esox TaxID=159716 RepID=A0AAN8CV68_9TELE|nr:hypothetical protein CesoFtcFv8_004456 [Champsocephalus esox]
MSPSSSSSTAVSIDQESTSGSATSSCSQIRGGLGSRKRKLPSNSYSQWSNRSEAGEEPPELLEEQEAAGHFLSDCPPPALLHLLVLRGGGAAEQRRAVPGAGPPGHRGGADPVPAAVGGHHALLGRHMTRCSGRAPRLIRASHDPLQGEGTLLYPHLCRYHVSCCSAPPLAHRILT